MVDGALQQELGWGADRLEEIEGIVDVSKKVEALVKLAIDPRLAASEQQTVLERALVAAESIQDSRARARALAEIAPQLPETEPQLLEKALSAAQAIENEAARARVLAAIAPRLPESDPVLLERALAAADNIQDDRSKAEALSAIALRLPESEQRAVLERALAAADTIQHDRSKAAALSAIALRLPETERRNVLERALVAAESIQDEYARTDALAAIAPQLPKTETDILKQALAAAQAIADDEFRANVLVRLAPNLPEALLESAKASVSKEVWQAAAKDFQQKQGSATQPEQAPPVPNITNFIAQSFKNDAAEGVDLLGIEPEVYALAEVLGMRALTPPLAVGILGGWGSGKSFVMHLMQERLNAINHDSITEEQAWGLKAGSPGGEASPYVGHVYQIYFNSWTYAKADLWSSLMQTIFYEFNCQLTVEKHLRDTFALHNAVTSLFKRIKKDSETINSDEILNIIEGLLKKKPETDKLLKILEPQAWEKIKEPSNNEKSLGQKLTSLKDIDWAILGGDSNQYFDKDTVEEWQKEVSDTILNEIWNEAQKYAIRKILEGGKIGDIISTELTADERDDAIRNEPSLGELGLLIWQELIASSRTQGVIWTELSNLRHRDQKELQAVEKSLLSAEKDLENKQKTAELSAQKKLEQEKKAIYWNPVLSQAYKLLSIEPKQVDLWKATLKNLKQPLIKYVALGCLFMLLVVGFSPGWLERIAALKVIFEQVRLFLIGVLEKTWFISGPSSVVLLVKFWEVSQQYFDDVKKAEATLESQYQEWLAEAKKDAKILESSHRIEGLRLQAEQKRLQVGLVADQSSLLSFVTNRLQEDSYDRRLGLIHQISRDLGDLSHRLVYKNQDPTSGRAQHIRDLFPRGPARVVLYIDDLDRCPPDRVVNVLEAVQLLLNTSLFVVVLAIDDRYIARALEAAYQGVLKRGGSPSGIDYLEKIIQIPYRTRPISGNAIGAYLKNHIDIEQEEQAVSALVNREQGIKDPAEGSDSHRPEDVRANLQQKLPLEAVKPPPSQVAKFTVAEFETLEKYCQEVDLSPRTAKRLINIYKILKILWFRSKRDQRQNAETIKKAVLAILVLSGRYPTFMREVLAEISRFYEERDDEKSEQADQKLLKDCFEESLAYLKRVQDPYLAREHKKFSHDVNRIIEPLNLKLRDIGAENFNLALSFCFVGDIGYDPADYQVEESKAKENGKY